MFGIDLGAAKSYPRIPFLAMFRYLYLIRRTSDRLGNIRNRFSTIENLMCYTWLSSCLGSVGMLEQIWAYQFWVLSSSRSCSVPIPLTLGDMGQCMVLAPNSDSPPQNTHCISDTVWCCRFGLAVVKCTFVRTGFLHYYGYVILIPDSRYSFRLNRIGKMKGEGDSSKMIPARAPNF